MAVAMLVALAAAGCGGSKGGPIPGGSATALNAALDGVQSRYESGHCASASNEVARLASEVRALPRSVDRDTRQTLNDGVARLGQLVSQCQPRQTAPQTQTTTTTTMTTTAPSTTQPTQSQTQTTQTQTQTTNTTTPPVTTGNGGAGTTTSGGVSPPAGK